LHSCHFSPKIVLSGSQEWWAFSMTDDAKRGVVQ
jgi:hypothetical protein